MMHHRTSPRPPVRASRLERWDKASGQQGDRCDHLPGNVESAMIKSRRLVVALLIVAGLFGCRSKKAETLPDELIGSWETSAPQYPNSFIEITDDSVIFGTEEGTGNAYTIDGWRWFGTQSISCTPSPIAVQKRRDSCGPFTMTRAMAGKYDLRISRRSCGPSGLGFRQVAQTSFLKMPNNAIGSYLYYHYLPN